MEKPASINQLLPLPTDYWHPWPVWDLPYSRPYRRWVTRVSAIYFTTASLAITFIWHQLPIKEELFCEQEIVNNKQPWNFSIKIKFTVVKFLSVLIFVNVKNFWRQNFWNYVMQTDTTWLTWVYYGKGLVGTTNSSTHKLFSYTDKYWRCPTV